MSVVEWMLPRCPICDTYNSLVDAPKGTRAPKKPFPLPAKGKGGSGPSLGGDDDVVGDLDDEDDGGGLEEPLEEPAEAIPIGEIDVEHPERVSFGMKGLNRVLGKNKRSTGPYGAARGSCIMLKAKPGVGKTTLAMQIAKKLARRDHKVLIATGEQSASDIRIYAEGFGELGKREQKNLLVLKTQSTDDIIKEVERYAPILVIVDSVQMMRSANVEGKAASEPQCKYIHHQLVVGTCKPLGVVSLLISQVTKKGEFRGPNTLAHLADADLLLEQELDDNDAPTNKRSLMAETKNRFGEAGIEARFAMTDRGLVGLKVLDKPKAKKRGKRSRYDVDDDSV